MQSLIKGKKEGKDQESVQLSTTPDQGKWQRHNRHKYESQEVSPFPAADHKASTNRRAWKYNKTRQK